MAGVWLACGFTALLPVATFAQDSPDVAARMPYMAPVAQCLEAAGDPAAAQACIGRGAATCMDTDPAQNQTTAGMMFCTLAEAQLWDDQLNVEYRKLRDRARRMDAGESQPEYAVRAARLLDAQRAWIAFRDADCALAYAEYGAGSMRVLSSAGCQLQLTAERTIALKFMFQEM